MAGPQVRRLEDLARSYLRAAGRRRPVLPVPLASTRLPRVPQPGGHLAPDRAVGRTTFEDFLARHVRPGTR